MKFWPSSLLQKFHLFWVDWIENHESGFPETFQSPSASGEESTVSVFCSSNLSFRQNQPRKSEIWTLLAAQRNFTTKISDFIGWFLPKREISWAKNWHSSFLSRQWKAVESFSKIWILVSNSAYQKMAKFLRAGKKVKISNFMGLFCLKDQLFEQRIDTESSCPDNKELWKVLAKSKPLLPSQS